MKNFLVLAPLKFVVSDVLGEPVRTPRRSKYLLVISDHFSKLVRTIPLWMVTADVMTKAFATL